MNGTDDSTTHSKKSYLQKKPRLPLLWYKEDLVSLGLKMTLAPKLTLARSTRQPLP